MKDLFRGNIRVCPRSIMGGYSVGRAGLAEEKQISCQANKTPGRIEMGPSHRCPRMEAEFPKRTETGSRTGGVLPWRCPAWSSLHIGQGAMDSACSVRSLCEERQALKSAGCRAHILSENFLSFYGGHMRDLLVNTCG